MMTDPIADMLTRIRNAQRAQKKTVVMPLSKLKLRIAEILRDHHYLETVATESDAGRTVLTLTLKYDDGRPAIQSIARESKPGYRQYRHADELPTVLNGYGLAIVSTSRGLMTNVEARKLGIGGEIICSVS